jgi:tetratricopeptide (TPR) repeat protein
MKNKYKKYIYLFVLFDIIAITLILIYFFGLPAYILIISGLLLLLIGRLVNYPLRNFYRGFSALNGQDWEAAEDYFLTFLKEIEEQPWKKKLMYYNFGNYTSDIDAMAHNNLGLVYLEKGAFDKAEDHLNKALSIDKQYSKAYYNLAVVRLLQQKPEEAKPLFEKAVEFGFENSSYDQFISNVQKVYGEVNKF